MEMEVEHRGDQEVRKEQEEDKHRREQVELTTATEEGRGPSGEALAAIQPVAVGGPTGSPSSG